MVRSFVFASLLIAGVVQVSAQAQPAAQYPARPVRIIVPQSPGASTDLTARLIAQKLAPVLGQSVIVENRPGAGSVVGTELVANATPDGHTLLVVASSITLNPIMHKNLSWHPTRDFAPITQISSFPNILVVGVPGYDHTPWNGFLAPAKTPRAIITRLNEETARILHAPDTKAVFMNEGAEPVGNKPEEFAAIIKSEIAKWTNVIQAAGIKAD